MNTCVYIYDISLIFLRMRNISVKSCREYQNTHFVFNNFFPRKSCRLWDHVEKYGRARHSADDDITRHMRFACWITTAMLVLGKKWLLECTSILHLYVHWFFCFQVVSTFEIRWLFVCIRHHCQTCYIPRHLILPDLLAQTVYGPHGDDHKIYRNAALSATGVLTFRRNICTRCLK